MTAAELARKIRNREQAIGYWVILDAPVAAERLARLGYDYVALDGQHGLIGQAGLLANLMAIDAGGRSVGLVRVESGDPAVIGRALDHGAGGVIVPLVDTAEARPTSAWPSAAGSRTTPGSPRSSRGPWRRSARPPSGPGSRPASTTRAASRPPVAWPRASRSPPSPPISSTWSRPRPRT